MFIFSKERTLFILVGVFLLMTGWWFKALITEAEDGTTMLTKEMTILEEEIVKNSAKWNLLEPEQKEAARFCAIAESKSEWMKELESANAIKRARIEKIKEQLDFNRGTAPSPAKKEEPRGEVEVAVVTSSGKADLDALARAVARHETCDCTCGTGSSKNNCFGIMQWKNGVRSAKSFATKEDSYEEFKALWTRGYGGRLPTLKDAQVYSGNDRAEIWHANVLSFYHQELSS